MSGNFLPRNNIIKSYALFTFQFKHIFKGNIGPSAVIPISLTQTLYKDLLKACMIFLSRGTSSRKQRKQRLVSVNCFEQFHNLFLKQRYCCLRMSCLRSCSWSCSSSSRNKELQSLSFLSKALTKAQRNYITFDEDLTDHFRSTTRQSLVLAIFYGYGRTTEGGLRIPEICMKTA